jgi:hypothetical protein
MMPKGKYSKVFSGKVGAGKTWQLAASETIDVLIQNRKRGDKSTMSDEQLDALTDLNAIIKARSDGPGVLVQTLSYKILEMKRKFPRGSMGSALANSKVLSLLNAIESEAKGQLQASKTAGEATGVSALARDKYRARFVEQLKEYEGKEFKNPWRQAGAHALLQVIGNRGGLIEDGYDPDGILVQATGREGKKPMAQDKAKVLHQLVRSLADDKDLDAVSKDLETAKSKFQGMSMGGNARVMCLLDAIGSHLETAKQVEQADQSDEDRFGLDQ